MLEGWDRPRDSHVVLVTTESFQDTLSAMSLEFSRKTCFPATCVALSRPGEKDVLECILVSLTNFCDVRNPVCREGVFDGVVVDHLR